MGALLYILGLVGATALFRLLFETPLEDPFQYAGDDDFTDEGEWLEEKIEEVVDERVHDLLD